MRRPGWQFATETLVMIGVLAAALWVYSGAARRLAYMPDEGDYISTARYFGYLFLRHDITRPDWGDSYLNHAQPNVARYILGGWLWARGYDLDKVPSYRHWDMSKSFEENRSRGWVPGDELLWEVRNPMVLLVAGSVALLYLLGRILGGPIAGLSAATFVLASPLALDDLPLAVNEPPLVFFVVLGLLLAVLGARRGHRGSLPTGWAIALGAALGLAVGSKLTAVLSLVAIIAWGALVAAAAWRRAEPLPRARLARAWAAGRGWALALGIALAIFVISDPHLYPNPPLHIGHFLDHRVHEMQGQQLRFPGDALTNALDRPRYVLGRSLIAGTWNGSRGLPLEAVLAGAGAALLVTRTWRGRRGTGRSPIEALVLLTVLVYFGGVSAGLLLAWDRFFIPTLVLGSLLSGLGLSAICRQLGVLGAALRSPRQSAPARAQEA